jgi:biopolymer transport protein ExbB
MLRFALLPVVAASLISWGALAEEAQEGALHPGTAASAPANPSPESEVGTAAIPSKASGSSPAAPAADAVTTSPVSAHADTSAELTKVGGPLPDALSPWGMFVQADIVVKAVMIGLALASVATWTVLLAKTIQLRTARRQARRALTTILSARSLMDVARQFAEQQHPVALLLSAADEEVDKSRGLPADGIKERVAWQLERIEAAAGRQIGRGMGILATIGAVAPFVGLFGTVWGIMNSFIGISRAHTTNLAVVAPGIAEALLATAFGLVAAIPAVVIYNAFARSTGSYRSVLGDATIATLRLLSRDLDRGAFSLDVRRGLRATDAPTLSIAESAE